MTLAQIKIWREIRPTEAHHYQRLEGPYEITVVSMAVLNNGQCHPNPQASNDAWFIMAAFPAPDLFSIIIARVWRVDLVIPGGLAEGDFQTIGMSMRALGRLTASMTYERVWELLPYKIGVHTDTKTWFTWSQNIHHMNVFMSMQQAFGQFTLP
ncbi:hypothetical protein OG21DRAFT_1525923 [Imleria badia]|nr:hypothetical protein OG21DRAFT_1525923 [Imleria badia]